MTQMPVEANVVLTADNSQYDQTMMASAGQTQQLANTVDSLTKKLASISRSAGRGLIGIAAADVGVITAATAAWGAYESQTSRLSAQAAIISRNSMEQTRTMGAYTKSVNQLREGYGTTTREGARLVETISRLTQNRATRDMTGLTKVFTDMSKATGEDSSGLAGSLLNLQKVMGTQVDRRTTRRYADQLTYLSQQTGTSAASLADFSAQIGPVGQLLNMTQTEVTGVATAFSQAGQDGYGAASAFNKVVTDIAYATESGSPALANYANLMGMTVDQFKDMEGTEQVLRFFERVGELGPAAIEDLQRLGYDGQRLVRYVTGVANQSGGLRTAIAEATGAMDSNASAKGAQAAMRGVGDELAKIREEGLRIGEIFAEWSGPVMVKVLQGVESLASALRKMMEGPLGDVVKAASMIAAPFAAAAGAVLSMAAPLATLATAALFFRGAGFRGFREGLQGAPRVAESGLQPVGLGRTGQQIAERGSAFQRNIYNASNMLGRVVGPPAAALASSRIFGGTNPNNLPLWQRGVALGLNGAAWGVRNVGTSIYSPLTMAGYRDPTQRVRLLNDSRPFRQQFMDAFRETTTGRTQGSGRQGVVGNTSLFDPNMRINDEGKVSTVATDARAAREEERRRADAERQRTSTIARSTATMGSAFGNVVRASGAVAGAMTSAATQATLLAGKLGAAGLGKFAGSGAAIGTGALMAGSAMGIDSNALTFGATGLMFGAKYGAIGAVAGAGFDVYQQNKNRNEVQANYEKTLANGSPSEVFAAGQPISDEFNRINNLFEERNTTWTRGIPVLGAAIGGYSPQQIMQQSLLGAEGLFTGSNPVKKSFDAEERRQMEEQNTVGAYQALSSRLGNEVTGFDFKSEADWAKLDEVLLKITPAMEELGITSEDIVKTWQEGDSAEWVALMNQIANPGKYTGLAERIGILNESGERFNENPLVATAIEQPENINAQYQAISNELADSLRQGMSYREVIRQRGDIMATVGTTDAPEYQLNAAIMGQARQALAYQQPFMTRTGGYRQQAGLLTDQVQMAAGDPAQQDQVNAQVGQFMQATVGQVQYFQQLLLQQREFNISRERSEEDFARQQERSFYQYTLGRERAEEDFNLSRKYAQFDFHLARERQEYQYELSRERAKDNFYRSMNRSERNFQISRNRAERDHAHQVELMAEQAARTQMNIYQRTEVQRTASAEWVLFNAQEQLQDMQEQAQNLDRLRGMGMSDNAIQQLDFTNPQMAQQLSRFVADAVQNPELIQQFNAAIGERLQAATTLVTDESSSQWEEFERQYRQSSRRAQRDFERQVRQSHVDFNIQMDQMADDFRLAMSNQQDDFERAQDRQNTAFDKSMDRAAADYALSVDQMVSDFGRSMNRAEQDMNRAAKSISGTMEEILTKAMNKLSGSSRKQAAEVLGTFTGLQESLGTQGVDIMTQLSKIFGFEYTPPKVAAAPSAANGGTPDPRVPDFSAHDGGVLPGRSVGRDNMHFVSKEHGNLHLAGGEAIMVPEWVDAVGGPAKIKEMNAAARYRREHSFWMGGTMPLPGATSISKHESGYASSTWSGDLNWPGRTDYGRPVVAYHSGIARPYDYGRDYSYGRGVVIEGPGGTNALYAHLSSMVAGIAGQVVRAGQTVGYVGDYGNTGSPPTSHLHFEIKNGGWSLPWIGNKGLSMTGLPGAPGDAAVTGSGLLRDSYPDVERAAAAVKIGGGPFQEGFWSKKLNRMARQALRKAGVEGSSVRAAQAGQPVEDISHDDISGGNNQAIVRDAMREFGWFGQWPALRELVQHESGFRNTAQNPTSTAYGMFQFLDQTWPSYGGTKTSDPKLQALYGMRYIKDRYDDPNGAWDFWQRNGWYGSGSIFTGPQTIGVGERGPEAVIPLNQQGAEFIADIFRRTSVGTEGRRQNVAFSTPSASTVNYNYKIDRSTTFSGAITVQSNNPDQFVAQLRARERTRALAQPSLGGRRVG